MKIKIKNFNGELPSYLTMGKVYDAKPSEDKKGASLTNDWGNEIYVNLEMSCHLDDGSWEVVE